MRFENLDYESAEKLSKLFCVGKTSSGETACWLRMWKLWGKLTKQFIEMGNVFDVFSFAQRMPSFANLILKESEVHGIIEEAQCSNIHIITPASVHYPKHLARIYDFPHVLYAKGNLELLNKPMFAMVGSRSASAEALQISYNLAREVSQKGVVVVSGFANGIDTAACKGAMEYGTVQVLGSGINCIYPSSNAKLFDEVLQRGGLFVSEFPPSYHASPSNFPTRNRIITGLSYGVLIGQVNRKNGVSGTLVTLRIAITQGKEIFTYPGSILDERYKVSNNLLKTGTAHFATSASDIMEIIQPLISGKETPRRAIKTNYNDDLFKITNNTANILQQSKSAFDDNISKKGRIVLDTVSEMPISSDEISAICGMDIVAVHECLSELEILGEISNINGKYIRNH